MSSSSVSIERWLTRRDAAAYARLSEATIGREARRGRLRCARVGGRRALRFRRDWIDAWLAADSVGLESMGTHQNAPNRV
jgi:excisionase family DNA binding protein